MFGWTLALLNVSLLQTQLKVIVLLTDNSPHLSWHEAFQCCSSWSQRQLWLRGTKCVLSWVGLWLAGMPAFWMAPLTSADTACNTELQAGLVTDAANSSLSSGGATDKGTRHRPAGSGARWFVFFWAFAFDSISGSDATWKEAQKYLLGKSTLNITDTGIY